MHVFAKRGIFTRGCCATQNVEAVKVKIALMAVICLPILAGSITTAHIQNRITLQSLALLNVESHVWSSHTGGTQYSDLNYEHLSIGLDVELSYSCNYSTLL